MKAQAASESSGTADRAADGQITFHGTDPDNAAAAAISKSGATKCQTRTRLYRHGVLEREGFPVADISEYLKDHSAMVWLDMRDPDHEDLSVLSDEFGLHPVAIEDAVAMHERPKLDRYHGYLLLTAYAVHLDEASGELATSELAAFITEQALITIRKDDGLDIGSVVSYWDASPDLAQYGVGCQPSHLAHLAHAAYVILADQPKHAYPDEAYDKYPFTELHGLLRAQADSGFSRPAESYPGNRHPLASPRAAVIRSG